MKLYRSDTLQVINATKRAGNPITIPPCNFIGAVTTRTSDKWYPPRTFYLTAGYATSTSAGDIDLPIFVFRNRQRSALEPLDTVTATLMASTVLAPVGIKAVFGITDTTSPVTVNPGEWIEVVAYADSNHVGLVVQLFGLEV